MQTVGYRTGTILDPARLDWDGRGPRPIQWSAWYPTSGADPGVAPDRMFKIGPVAQGAPIAGGFLPVVLLSHGTGGTAESLGWLAHGLASQGHLVLGANHHGNCGKDPYRAEGFLCWWERAADCSHLLTALAEEGPFVGRLDLSRVGAVGFSLGGYTVLAMLGALTSTQAFNVWSGGHISGPREFPDAADQLPELMAQSTSLRASWARQGATYADPRLGRVVAIAPAPAVRGFSTESVCDINRPVLLITGGADREAPTETCADWLVALNPAFQHISAGSTVGHYTFLGQPTGLGRAEAPELFDDATQTIRQEVHMMVMKRVLAHFSDT